MADSSDVVASAVVLNDPVKAEWVVVRHSKGVINVRCFYDWSRNKDYAQRIADALNRGDWLDADLLIGDMSTLRAIHGEPAS